MMRRTLIAFILMAYIVGCILPRCTDPNGWKKADVSKETSNYSLQRFEKDFYAIDTTHMAESEAKIRAKYGSFYDFYVHSIMNFGKSENPMDTTRHNPQPFIANFLGNKAIKDLYDTVKTDYSDMSDIQTGLADMFKHFQYYFPKKPRISRVYTFITEFSYGVATYDDTTMCIGLDMYLGSQYRYYESIDLPEFMIAKLKRPYIVSNATEALYNLHFDRSAANAELPLVEAIINEGRKYYFMECMLPNAPDSLIIGYTSRQAEWCRNSEKSIWQFFNERDLLYKVNYMEQKRYTTDGPTTAGMPSDSPPKVGSWVGWQIVRKFMKNSGGKVTLNEMLDKYSAKQIFTLSNYKPK